MQKDFFIGKRIKAGNTFGHSETSQKRISKNISKKIEYLMISAKAVSYTEGYRSGHNEAVLKICSREFLQNSEKPWYAWCFRPSDEAENYSF